jgi:outer membrane protein OmpA-like peptidoglycan-associated protein
LRFVGFFRGSTVFTGKESIDVLAEIAIVLRQHPEVVKLAVIGHASSDEPSPDKLSEARGRKVMAALIAAGIEPSRLVAQAKGASAPIYPNSDPAQRAMNRRIEFQILERTQSCPSPAPTPMP